MNNFPHGDGLREILRDFPREKVESFIARAFVIWVLTPQMQRAATRKARLVRLRKALKAAQAFMRVLEATSMLDAEYEQPPSVGALLRRIQQGGGLLELVAALKVHYCSPDAADDPERDDPELRAALEDGNVELLATIFCARERREERLIDSQQGRAGDFNRGEIQAIAEAIKSRRPLRPHLETTKEATIHSVRTFIESIEAEIERTSKARVGRRSTDHDQMFFELAEWYWYTFDEPPTGTREPPSMFYRLAKALTGKSAPDRAVQSAIKALHAEIERARTGPPEDTRMNRSAALLTGQDSLDSAIGARTAKKTTK